MPRPCVLRRLGRGLPGRSRGTLTHSPRQVQPDPWHCDRSASRVQRILFPKKDHEAGPVRVLPHDRAGARPAPAQPAVHDEAHATEAGTPTFKQAPKDALLIPTRTYRTYPRRADRGSSTPARQLAGGDARMVQMNCIDMNARYSRVDRPDPRTRALRSRSARRRLRARDPRCSPDPRGARAADSVLRRDERRRRIHVPSRCAPSDLRTDTRLRRTHSACEAAPGLITTGG